MIISQTPYRVSFAGGGTDLPAFYEQDFGAVLSVAIARHMYVTVHRRFNPTIRVAYSRTETVEDPAALEHELVREALRVVGLEEHLEVTTIGDVPAGTGMGSSSTLTVGLLNAFYAYDHRLVSRDKLAELACRIEIDILGKPIGRQDQYAAAFGGLNYIRFNPGGHVEVTPIPCTESLISALEERILLVYTEDQRSADTILEKQSAGTADRMSVLTRMRDIAGEMRDVFSGDGDLDAFADMLNEGWELKRSLGFGITYPRLDEWYKAARAAGAQGGKLLGAGGGGFLMLMAPPERHAGILEALGNPRTLGFTIDRQGSRIIFVGEHQ